MIQILRHVVVLTTSFSLLGQAAIAAPIPGTPALPGARTQLAASLVLTPGTPASLDVAMTRRGSTTPLARYDVEMSKRLHVIAVSADLKAFVHEHADAPGADGHFRVSMPFPRGGAWHVYADAVPTGLGQQVMRFDVDAGTGAATGVANAAATRPVPPAVTGLQGTDGAYGVRFDTLDLRAGRTAQLRLHILRDGTPAPDLVPFLGVAAHAVFIDAANLAYVHVHATPASQAGHAGMAMPGMPGMAMPAHTMPAPGGAVPPDLVLHVTPPRAGTYVLWVQFMGGGAVRTVPFVVAVR